MSKTTHTVKVRIGLANIQNYPDHSDPVVRKMLAGVRDNCDLGLLCEIGEAADHKAVREVFGPDWSKTPTSREVPVVHKKAVLRKVGNSKVPEMSPGLGQGSLSPARYLVEETYEAVDAPDWFPRLGVQNGHYVQAAWNPKKVSHKALRKQHWNLNWERQQRRVLATHKAGKIVIFGADWNRSAQDIPKFHPDQQWVIGGGPGIDAVGVLLPKGVIMRVSRPKTVNNASDHDARFITLTFTATAPSETSGPAPTGGGKPTRVTEARVLLTAALTDARAKKKTARAKAIADAIDLLPTR